MALRLFVAVTLGSVARVLSACACVIAPLALAAPAQATVVKRVGARAYAVQAVAPKRGDLTLVRLDFRRGRPAPGRHAPALALALRRTLPPGYYLAAGRLVPVGAGRLSALAAIVYRSDAPAGPQTGRVDLTVSGARLTVRPAARELDGAFAHPAAASPVCASPKGLVAAGANTSAVFAHGPPVPGFSAAEALAGAFDGGCGRVGESAFETRVTGSCIPCPRDPRARPCPTFAPCPEAQGRWTLRVVDRRPAPAPVVILST
jgi:hypothetical protein